VDIRQINLIKGRSVFTSW